MAREVRLPEQRLAKTREAYVPVNSHTYWCTTCRRLLAIGEWCERCQRPVSLPPE